jgi:Ca-activated chloride channel family protein
MIATTSMSSTAAAGSGFELRTAHGGSNRPVLVGVQASGHLDGVLFGLTLRQIYRNTSTSVLEVIYTFPLAHQAVLLSFASELNGSRQVGTVVAKASAERQYEKALAAGDAPVMLEAGVDGVHTANIGNLKPGDELVIEVRMAQLLAFDQGRLRLAVPSTIAPRYGDPLGAGLQPQQLPTASMEAEYPLSLSLRVAGNLARSVVDCPTHRCTQQTETGVLRLDLAPGAWLDRDVVFTITPSEPLPSLLVRAADEAPGAAPGVCMAALQAPATAPRKQVALKLLVDCSGSMGGDSMTSARAALLGALAGLSDADQVSVTRFGSRVDQAFKPTACTPQALLALRATVQSIDADLGGTEMKAALEATIALRMPADAGGADILLVTDGEVWNADELIAAARDSGHRVFAIGVGSSPAEAVLRRLAEASGGACEFATPGEALEAAAGRMMARIRQQPWSQVRIDWGCEPVWQTALPLSLFSGDTTIVFAGVKDLAAQPTVRLMAGDGKAAREIARADAEDAVAGDALPRIAASRRLATASEREARALAVAYQLLSPHTNCVLVHERAVTDRVTDEAQLHQVGSMLAAGWGATSSTTRFRAARAGAVQSLGVLKNVMQAPSVSHASRHVSAACHASPPDLDDMFSLAGGEAPPLSSQVSPSIAYTPIEEVLTAVAEHLQRTGSSQGLVALASLLNLDAAARGALDESERLGCTADEAWLVLAHWINSQEPDDVLTALLARVLLRIDPAVLALVEAAFYRRLDPVFPSCAGSSRADRLSRAMAR